MTKRHFVLYGALATLTALGAAFVLYNKQETRMSDSNLIQVNGFTYEIASTTEALILGLGGRTSIPENYGMLFVFPTPGIYGFWMKDMLVPIDILWLSDTGTILSIDASVSPDTYPKAYYPTSPASFVLETRAGESARRGLVPGAHVSLPLPYRK